jgi:antitoxin MazE
MPVIKRAPMMRRKSTVSRWGRSLGLRIPQEAVDQLNLKAGEQVSMELAEDRITIKRSRSGKKWTEAALLKGVKPEMVGGEVDWGGPVGKELW